MFFSRSTRTVGLVSILFGMVAYARPLIAQEGKVSHFPKIADRLQSGSEPVTIVCIGDSITGVYYHTGGRRAYPEILGLALRHAYPKAKVQVINAGISGNTLPQGLVRLENDVLRHQPQLVTIMYGMNDLTRFSVAEFKKHLVEMSVRCRKQGAEVLLCTQNSIYDGPRSSKKLAEFTQAIHAVGREHNLPVADCHLAYEAVRTKDAKEWALLMSDEIHPNMDGHKVFARVIARTITGKDDALNHVGPPAPAIPRTLSLLKANKPIKVLAMPPFDKAIGPALKEIDPAARVEVTTWPTDGQTIAQLEQAAKKVRSMGVDLVVVAVPVEAGADSTDRFIRSFSWVLSSSLSFGHQQWDVIAAPPSTTKLELTEKESQRDRLVRRLIAAQDLSMMTRPVDDATPLHEFLVRWLKGQMR